jgi:hypothetical protein
MLAAIVGDPVQLGEMILERVGTIAQRVAHLELRVPLGDQPRAQTGRDVPYSAWKEVLELDPLHLPLLRSCRNSNSQAIPVSDADTPHSEKRSLPGLQSNQSAKHRRVSTEVGTGYREFGL